LEQTFNKDERNPLAELAELRMAVKPDGEFFDIVCQLRLSSSEVSFNGREYRVGISETRLQLHLEGWETSLGCDFGDAPISTITEEEKLTRQAGVSGAVGMQVGPGGVSPPTGSAKMQAQQGYSHTLGSTRTHLPMTALPNNAWRVKSGPAAQKADQPLDGTAIGGERLCRLERKSGGNRLSMVAELQVRRSNITVKPVKGDMRGKVFSLMRNKDAIVAKILEKALFREASTVPQAQPETTVVVSKTEISEA